MGPTLLCELGLFLLCTLLCTGHAQDAVLTIEPNWSSFFIGEFVTFICDMNEGADTDWEYKINKDGREFVPYNTHKDYRLQITSTGLSGKYQCTGRRKWSRDTKNSNTVSVTVSDAPRATLTAGATIIPVGGRVTLTCSVGSSAEWKYEWFRRTQSTTEVHIRRDDQQNRVIRVTQGGIYRCRGRRGNPVFYTHISDEVTIEITFSNKVAVKQQHNWPQIFSGETITLTCEVEEGGETTEWEYQWRRPRQTTQWTHNNYLTFSVSESSSGDYMCKSRLRDDSYSTEWSEAFTLSVSGGQPKAKLRADNTAVPVGGSVTLTCSVNPSSSSSGWKYYWYRDEKHSEPLTTQDAVSQSNGQIRVSQEGLYRCRGGRGDPVYYTEDSESVRIDTTGFRGESCSFLVPFIVGLVCGSSLIVPVLLCCMCCRTRIKDPCSNSFMQSPNINRGSATSQSETQVYSSLLHGDLSVYESVRNSGNTQSGGPAGECSNVASTIQLDERRRHDAAEESSDYKNVNPESASGP